MATAASRSAVVIGLPEAQAKLAMLTAALAKTMPAVLTAGALPVMNKAKGLAPYRTGNLRRSIHVEVTGPTEVVVGTDVVYAAAQEFGRSDINLPAHPYLRPALDTSVSEATAAMQRSLSVLIGAAP